MDDKEVAGLIATLLKEEQHLHEDPGALGPFMPGEAETIASALSTLQAERDAARDALAHANHMQRVTQDDLNAAEARIAKLEAALREIDQADPVGLALDPELPQRIVRAALTDAPGESHGG